MGIQVFQVNPHLGIAVLVGYQVFQAGQAKKANLGFQDFLGFQAGQANLFQVYQGIVGFQAIQVNRFLELLVGQVFQDIQVNLFLVHLGFQAIQDLAGKKAIQEFQVGQDFLEVV